MAATTHYLVLCPLCTKVMSQCRCPGPKIVTKSPIPCAECTKPLTQR